MTRILNLVAQSAFAAAGALLVLYAVLVRPMPPHRTGAILAAGIGCLSLALALTWASVFRHKRLVTKPSAISRQR